MRYHLTLVRMAIIKKKKPTNKKCWKGCGERGTFQHCWQGCGGKELSYTVDKNVNWLRGIENNMEVP